MEAEFINLGLAKGTVTVTAGEIQPTMKDKDPQELYVKYTSLYYPNPYLADDVKIEVGVRSKLEPFSKVEVNSLLTEFFRNDAYASVPFAVQAVEPRKTFLEKAFLLQEEFEKSDRERIRTDRMSRHYKNMAIIRQDEIFLIKEEKLKSSPQPPKTSPVKPRSLQRLLKNGFHGNPSRIMIPQRVRI